MSVESKNNDTVKKPNLLLTILSVLCIIGAIITLIPCSNIENACMLGYKAICAFTPVSTIILIIAGVILWILRKKF